MLEWAGSLWQAAGAVPGGQWALVISVLSGLLYVAGTWTHGYFRSRGLPFSSPLPFLGNMAPLTFGSLSFNDYAEKMYYQFQDYSVFGIFQFMTPVVFVRDPEIIKKLAVKDFDHFVDHQTLLTEKLDPLMAKNLFALRGQEWRDMRATLSPAFTASKMRNIFKLVDQCGCQTVEFLKEEIRKSPLKVYEADMKDFFTRFTNDVIATTAFGIQCDSLRDRRNAFYVMGRDLTNTKGLRTLLFLGYLLSPKLMEILNLPFIPPKVRDFFHGSVHETIRERQKQGIFRPDMLQLLMQARAGQLKAEAGDEEEVVTGARKLQLTDTDITAQAVIFFFAGFDTVSTLMCFSALELARQPGVQQRLQRDVDAAVERSGGQLTYETVQDLKYLDMVLNEVLRLYPPVAFLNRKCVADYTIEATGNLPSYTIKKEDIVWFAASALHRDPKYWSNPNVFDPERFSEENKANIKPFTYMPFGVGPRLCIGSRFALMETKIALAHILHHFSFVCTGKTPKVVKFAKRDFNASVEGGFWLGIAPRAK
ncbi:hypothetical protein R5R35_009101 [Gryllus longicercus]|uniref:Cytochrome P450 n=1 Tax=Gryllus longicercus TaxID=2509291 RepID=A0AAN9ZCV2_9ORTH